jgi:hypothetical protein
MEAEEITAEEEEEENSKNDIDHLLMFKLTGYLHGYPFLYHMFAAT